MENAQPRRLVIGLAIILFAVIAVGLFWLFSFKGSVGVADSGLGFFWWIFSFAAGLSMIVLPCTLPLAFVIVPLSMGKGIRKGLGMALSFGAGIAITLSLYGIIAALVGQVALETLGAPLETVKNWVYFVAGIFALLFALSEIGLLKFRMPTYTGAAPAFIQRRQDYLKALLLGLFLGNIGIGCPHPATPLILVEIASSGNVLYGWLLFLVHAVGRVLPLLFLALLGIMGVNGLSWLTSRKERVERITGWAMVFVAGFILTLGLFTHDWWVNSGIHTQLEKLTQEESLLSIVRENIGSEVTHEHGPEEGSGLFGLPLWLGNWFLVLVWIVPLWWWWFKDARRVREIPAERQTSEQTAEHRLLLSREKFFTTLTLLLGILFIYLLPHNFLEHESRGHGGDGKMPFDENVPHGHDAIGNSLLPSQSPSSVGQIPIDERMPHGHDAAGNSLPSNDHGSMMGKGEHMNMGGAHTAEEGDVTEGIVANFSLSAAARVGVETALTFFVNQKPAGNPVDDLEIEHERFYHLVGVREDLNQFVHLHPEKTSAGRWAVSYAFPQPGVYKFWSGLRQGGVTHSFGHPRFPVAGADGKIPSLRPTPEFLSSVSAGDYRVSLAHRKPLAAERSESLRFTIRDTSGSPAALENYLGESMHLVIIKDDLSEYVHTHPGEGTEGGHDASDGHHGFQIENIAPMRLALAGFPVVEAAGTHAGPHNEADQGSPVVFSATFPSAGVYKVFGQFRPRDANLAPDETLLAEFYVRVAERGVQGEGGDAFAGVDPRTKWWILLAISLVLIPVLSYGVHRYLRTA